MCKSKAALRILFSLLAVLALLLCPAAPGAQSVPVMPAPGELPPVGMYHAGELLVAAPGMPDPRFRGTVIFLIKHDATGALGLIINRPGRTHSFAALMHRLGLSGRVPKGGARMLYGGPVQPNLGFVLHTPTPGVEPVYDLGAYVVSTFPDVLRAMSRGKGPAKKRFLFGYAGWAAGQLEGELAHGGWYTAPADPDILFDDDYPTKWHRAIERRFKIL